MTQTIRLNGESEPLVAATVYELLQSKNIGPENKGVAVALNGTVLPRKRWVDTRLSAGDTVDIVTAFVGG